MLTALACCNLLDIAKMARLKDEEGVIRGLCLLTMLRQGKCDPLAVPAHCVCPMAKKLRLGSEESYAAVSRSEVLVVHAV